jgi:1L-myo-inositol 1-phosphate cytidylyltransferase / CDP-L-myo-inositol myo-inositolphosphotransferase
MNGNTISRQKANHTLSAIILAAGSGHRLHSGNGGIPKPLTPLLGRTLLERTLLSCREMGISDFYVVVGYCAEAVAAHAEEVGQRFTLTVRAVRNPDWKAGNGTSVLAVSRHIAGPFLLLMCDHIFDVEILRHLLEIGQSTDRCLLAVDRRVDQVFDIADATKVKLDGLGITAIGKDIAPFDAIDVGIFLCQPSIFEALEKAWHQGDGSLSGGVRELIRQGQMRAVDIKDCFWHDVDTPLSLSHANHLLLTQLSKPSEDGFIAHYLNRPLSRRVSKRLAHTSLTPNTLTALSFFIALSGAFSFVPGQLIWTLLGGILIQLASIIDGCDGEIARLKFQSSSFGAWLDTILDRYADVAIVVAISYGYWRSHPQPLVWVGGCLALTGFLLSSYTRKEYVLRYKRNPPNTRLNKLLKRDMRLFALFTGALLNLPFATLIILGLLSHLAIAGNFVTIYRKEKAAATRTDQYG